MHRGHDHDHQHHGNGAVSGHNHGTPPRAMQWQTPHLPHDHVHEDDHHHEPDLDLVEMAFVEAFATTKDPTSFLRLAQIPFEVTGADGAKLVLLRVESDAATDVGALMLQLGGGAMRYAPLPARMVTHRRKLRFIYSDGSAPRVLTLGQVRQLV